MSLSNWPARAGHYVYAMLGPNGQIVPGDGSWPPNIAVQRTEGSRRSHPAADRNVIRPEQAPKAVHDRR